MLILYPDILLNACISFRSFLVECLGIKPYCLHMGILTSYLFFFSCLIAIAKTSRIIQNRDRESDYPCLVPDFSGNVLSLSGFTMMLAAGQLKIASYASSL